MRCRHGKTTAKNEIWPTKTDCDSEWAWVGLGGHRAQWRILAHSWGGEYTNFYCNKIIYFLVGHRSLPMESRAWVPTRNFSGGRWWQHPALDPRRNIDGWAEQKGELERALREALFLAEKVGAIWCNGNIISPHEHWFVWASSAASAIVQCRLCVDCLLRLGTFA